MRLRSAALAFVVSASAAASAGSYYLALGDSVAFGYENTQPLVQSYGDRGYVGAVADRLQALTGARPTVLNLAIPGETSTSFADASNPYSLINANYGVTLARPSQQDAARQAETTLGSAISTVSFAIGSNDYLALSTADRSDPVILQALFANISARYASALTDVRKYAPNATLLLPGYYVPYAPGTAEHDPAASAVAKLDLLIQGYAAQFNGRYVDFYTPIEGNQATLIGVGDVHPNDAGYAVLGRAAAQAVPEPMTFLALGTGALALLRRRRR